MSIDKNIDKGVEQLLSVSPLVTALILVIVVLIWFIRDLLKSSKEDRMLSREDAKHSTNALINNTAVISEFKELIRNALNK